MSPQKKRQELPPPGPAASPKKKKLEWPLAAVTYESGTSKIKFVKVQPPLPDSE
jgi:hypothetical protein